MPEPQSTIESGSPGENKGDPRESVAQASICAVKDRPGEADAQSAPASSDGSESDGWQHEEAPGFFSRAVRLLRGIDGVGVMLFGVCVPTFAIVSTCLCMPKRLTLVLLNHPVETLVELALLCLIPVTNFVLWRSLRKSDVRFGAMRGVLAGNALMSSLMVAAISIAAGVVSKDASMNETSLFQIGFSWLAMLGLFSAGASAYLVYCYQRSRDFAPSRRLITGFTAMGAALSALAFVGAEAKPWLMRVTERAAVSSKPQEREPALTQLRMFTPEREMTMECTDPRAAGLCGLFLPLKKTAQQELYFALTGKPFSFKDGTNSDLSAMPDDYVQRHAVGDPVDGLSLVRSLLTSSVHPTTLSSAVTWTFVLKNETNFQQDARAEIALPPGAVITGLDKWKGPEIQNAVIAATGKAQQEGEQWQSTGSGSATISSVGQDRVLLQCSPIEPDTELKVEIKAVVPLKPDDAKSASLLLPKLIASNFSVADENALKLYSPAALTSGFDELKSGFTTDGIKTLSGVLPAKRVQSAELLITTSMPKQSNRPIAVLDKLAVKLEQEDIRRVELARRREAARKAHGRLDYVPQQIVFMVDGRNGIKQELQSIGKVLGEHHRAHEEKAKIVVVKPEYVVQSVRPLKATAPRQLIVVIDGSSSMKGHIEELKQSLARVSPKIPVSLMVATRDQEKLGKPLPLRSGGLKLLDEAAFNAGENNLKSVIDASDLAGAGRGGAVLWIHGPQPVINGEIYPTTPYYEHPAFYELPIDSGEIDTGEFFKNHSDIGPFMQVSHNTNLSKDIDCFFSKWQPNGAEYTVAMDATKETPSDAVLLPENEARELLQLHASQECARLLTEHKPRRAARVAVAYGIVTPVSSAVISEGAANLPENPEDDPKQQAAQSQSAPGLEGATNGTIGPQGNDAVVITGINTAGAVRVNNLANLEALLNLLANGCEILFVGLGSVLLISSFAQGAGKFDRQKMLRRVALGATLVVIGLATPGAINWFVASARDANLFS